MPTPETTLNWATAKRKFKSDNLHWSLFVLTTTDAHELIDRPLKSTPELLRRGWVKVTRHYTDGQHQCRVIAITPEGHAELERSFLDV